MRAYAVALIPILLTACASTPAPTSPVAASPASAAPSAKAAAAPVAPDTAKVTRPPGYKVVERNGTTLFCTFVATLGTNLKQEICMTQDEYAEVQRRGESVRQDLRQATKMCAGGSGVGSCNGS
jgi:hypothetical protein